MVFIFMSPWNVLEKWKTFSRNIFQAVTYESCGDKEHNPPEEEELKMFVRLFWCLYKPIELDKKQQK